MQLTYRGLNSLSKYEVSAPKTTKLIYRGISFERTPNRVIPVQQTVCDTQNSVKLIYRGLTYNSTPVPVYPHHSPRAINWRYQVASKVLSFEF